MRGARRGAFDKQAGSLLARRCRIEGEGDRTIGKRIAGAGDMAGLQRDPQTGGRDEQASACAISGGDGDGAVFTLQVAAEGQPAKVGSFTR
jgi:hypothetical protein